MAKVLLVYPNLMLVSQLPNNIPILSACLKQAGHDVLLFDTTLYHTTEISNDEMRVERMQVRKFNIDDVGLKINENDVYGDFGKVADLYQPDLIAVTVVEDTMDMAIDLMRQVGNRDIPVVFGGVHPTLCPQEVLNNPEVDIVCVGEGEEALTELADAVNSGESYSDIRGLWSRNADGEIINNGVRALMDINSLPYEDFSIFADERIYRPMQGRMVAALPINFDRGCPYLCTFCAAPSLLEMFKGSGGQKYFRKKTNERIEAELEHFLTQYPVDYLYFNSETFLSMPIAQFRDFAKMYMRFKIPFWCQTHVQTVTEEKVALLKEMGINRMSLGIEHGSEQFRKSMLKKYFTNDQAITAMEIFHKYNVPVSVNNMLGYPDETRELVFETIELNRKLKADGVNGFVFQPYKGTFLYDYSLEKGYMSPDKKVDSPIGSSILNMPSISQEEIEGLLRTFVLYVKLPKKYWPEIELAEQLSPEGEQRLGVLRELLFEKYF